MDRFGLADQTDLKRWADMIGSQPEYPRLIRRLILETAPGVVHLGVPAGEGVATGGWDGVVRNTKATPFVPEGLSVWEFSVEKSVGTKADEDYQKRIATPDGSPTQDCTYVAAYLRRWRDRDKWASERTIEGRWREVRAYGIDAVEAWLEAAPVTRAWMSELLGLHPHGLRSAEAWWDLWSSSSTPALTPAIVLAGRSSQAQKLTETLVGAPQIITVSGPSVEEVVAFVAAVGRSDDLNGGGQLLSRMAFVDDLSAWRSLLLQEKPLVLVPISSDLAKEFGSGGRHHLVVPVGGCLLYTS